MLCPSVSIPAQSKFLVVSCGFMPGRLTAKGAFHLALIPLSQLYPLSFCLNMPSCLASLVVVISAPMTPMKPPNQYLATNFSRTTLPLFSCTLAFPWIPPPQRRHPMSWDAICSLHHISRVRSMCVDRVWKTSWANQ